VKAKSYHLAQVNIGRALGETDDPIMHGFMSRLDELNAIADRSPGFVWRLQTEEGNATYLRPYDDNRIMVNLSVWETVEHLKAYVYKTIHAELIQQRREWFEKFEGAYMALWWVEAGHIPTVGEAKQRLEYLQLNGETPRAFTFKRIYQPDDCQPEDLVVPNYKPCIA
jgi:hypothetical protein